MKGLVALVGERADWEAHGVCRGLDPDLFFPGRGDVAGMAAAKAVCALCPVAGACLEAALARPEKWGVWGGTSEAERRRIVRQRQTVSAAA